MYTLLSKRLQLIGGLLALVTCAVLAHAGEEALSLKNPGFESGLDDWFPAKGDQGMSVVSPEAAHSGKQGLRVSDSDNMHGSSLASAKFDAQAGATYEVRFWARCISGAGISVYLQFLDAKGVKLTDLEDTRGGSERLSVIKIAVPPRTAEWKQFTLRGVAPENSASVYLWVHSGATAISVSDLDDFELVKVN